MTEETLALNRVYLMDAIAYLRRLPSASVHAIIADPPYGTTALEWDIPIDWVEFWLQAKRVVVNAHCPIVLFSQQPFTTDLIVSNRTDWRYEIIWEKTMPVGFLDAPRRPLRCHENIEIFSKADALYFPVMERTAELRATARKRKGSAGQYNAHDRVTTYTDNGLRYPRSVWKFAQRHSAFERTHTNHPTEKPLLLMERLVETFSKPGDVVLDCFCGSGSTLVAAQHLNRRFLGCDTDQAFVEVARKRLSEPFTLPLFDAIAVNTQDFLWGNIE
jgi:site-specific DNA-methyltransferase (adenine-specific)